MGSLERTFHSTYPIMLSFLRSSMTTMTTWEEKLMFRSSWPGEWHDSDIMSGRIRRKLKIRSRSNDIFFERVTLRRRDGLEIPVARSSGHMFQLACLDNGMEMIWVVKLLQKSCETKICAHYYRVLRTAVVRPDNLHPFKIPSILTQASYGNPPRS